MHRSYLTSHTHLPAHGAYRLAPHTLRCSERSKQGQAEGGLAQKPREEQGRALQRDSLKALRARVERDEG